MKVCAMSDLHGDLPQIEECDLVLICGDIVSLKCQSFSDSCKKWYKKVFKPWAEELPCNKVLFIAGNHERGVQGHEEEYYELFPKDSKVTFLFDDLYTYKQDYKIYGTPWCTEFGHWAYMADNEHLKEIYSKIPEGLDILMTHDQPYGYGDILLQEDCPWRDGQHIGNVPLAAEVIRKQPKYMFVGHLHSTDHSCINIYNTKRYNVSLKDEDYIDIYKPLYIQIN